MAHILVVDDISCIREILRDFLETDGHEVTEASDGIMALELYHKEKYDLVIMDLIMPNKDGMEAIMELRNDYPDIKIIAISGGDKSFPASSYLNVTKSMGADSILAKPIGYKEMINAVENLLGNNNGS